MTRILDGFFFVVFVPFYGNSTGIRDSFAVYR